MTLVEIGAVSAGRPRVEMWRSNNDASLLTYTNFMERVEYMTTGPTLEYGVP